MINRPSKSANPTHYFGAVLKCALLLIFFTFGVEVYAQSYNMSESYRIGGSTQSTPSAMQGGYGEQGFQTSRGYQSQHDVNKLQPSTYATYQSTIYQPFGSSTPSMISGRRNTGDNDFVGDGYDEDFTWGGDGEGSDLSNPGYGPTGSPVGEPFVLLLFAAVAAVVVAWRQKKPIPAPEGKEI